MSYSKLPGVYFSETIGTIATELAEAPLFIIQTSTAIASIDEQIIKTNLAALTEVATDKGLTKTLQIIEQTLTEARLLNSEFYVYSVKTDTAANFSKIIEDSSHLTDIKTVFYIEETKSASGNSINSKLGALKAGADACAVNGVNRVIYAIPYGTVMDAIDNASSGTDESNCITSLTSIVNGINSGRVAVILPDYSGAIAGRVLDADYNEEIGYPEINTAIDSMAFNFTYSQMVTLQNLGILFIRAEQIRGTFIYRVNLGVSTAFAGNGADGLLLSRRVCDEVLNQVKYECDDFVKASTDVEGGLVTLQTDIDNVLERFIAAGEIFEDESQLVVSEGSDVYTFKLSGKIKPIKSTIAINVETTLA